HPIITIKILHDLFEGLPTIVRQNAGTQLLGLDDFLGLNLYVRGLPSGTTAGLVDHDSGMGLDKPSSLFAHGQKNGPHGSRQSTTNSGNRAFDLLDGVINGKARGHITSWTVDDQLDLLMVLKIQIEQTIYAMLGRIIIYLAPQKYLALIEQLLLDQFLYLSFF